MKKRRPSLLEKSDTQPTEYWPTAGDGRQRRKLHSVIEMLRPSPRADRRVRGTLGERPCRRVVPDPRLPLEHDARALRMLGAPSTLRRRRPHQTSADCVRVVPARM
jgi:hypothetical protein